MAKVARPHHYNETSLISMAMNALTSLIVFLTALCCEPGKCTALYDCFFSSIWPQYVKDRIHSTYMYFAGSIGMTALSAAAVSRTPAIMNLMTKGSWLVSFIIKIKVFAEECHQMMVDIKKSKKSNYLVESKAKLKLH